MYMFRHMPTVLILIVSVNMIINYDFSVSVPPNMRGILMGVVDT